MENYLVIIADSNYVHVIVNICLQHFCCKIELNIFDFFIINLAHAFLFCLN